MAVIPTELTPRRIQTPFNWYGGKGLLGNKIIPLLPPGAVYCEPFCGSASIFWHRPAPVGVEILNDLEGDIINLFRVLQNPKTFKEFEHRINWTPYSLDEFRKSLCLNPDASPLERAWAFYVRTNQGFGAIPNPKTEGRWSRALQAPQGVASNVRRWNNRKAHFAWWHSRLQNVQLDNRDALQVLRYWDSPETVFYLDPPYVLNTRKCRAYNFEGSDNFHNQLVETLLSIQGGAVLSGYATPIYEPLERAGWERHDFQTSCFAASRGRGTCIRGTGSATKNVPRVESVWVKQPGKIL